MSPEKAHRLEMYAFDHVDIFYEEVHHIADVVHIDAFHHGRHQRYSQARLLAVAYGSLLYFQQRFPAELFVYIVPGPVELHEHHRCTCILQDLRISVLKSQFPSVGIYLYVFESLAAGHADYLRQILSDSRLSPGKLYIERSFFAQLYEKVEFGLQFSQRWFAAPVRVFLSLCKAVRAVLVTSVCEVYQHAAGRLQMVLAGAAVQRTFHIVRIAAGHSLLRRDVYDRIPHPAHVVLRIFRSSRPEYTVIRAFLDKIYPAAASSVPTAVRRTGISAAALFRLRLRCCAA